MKSVKAILIIGVAVILTYCSPKLYSPSLTDISKAKSFWAEADSAMLVQGRNTYINKCGNCHYLYKPEMFSSQKWEHEMHEMRDEAKLSDNEYQLIRIYLLTNSKTGTRAGEH